MTIQDQIAQVQALIASKPQITPGSNGYQAMLDTKVPDNPWTGLAQADGVAAASATTQATANVSGLQGQLGQYQAQSTPYPSFPAASSQAPSPQPTPDSGSRGFNPWSTIGESNSR